MERRHAPRIAFPILSIGAFVALVLAFFVSGASVAQAAPHPASAAHTDCQQHVAGKHVYDCAGALTSAEISMLETHATAVDQAGAATVVYLQAKDATQDQTDQDAVNLMQNWDIESKAGAKDGFVIFLNLTPGNLQHGHVALYAGATLVNGPLPINEQERIFNDVMLPYLQNGQLADGISAALDAAATDIRAGAPVGDNGGTTSGGGSGVSGPVGDPTAQAIGGWPFNILALLLAAFALLMLRHHPGRRPAIPDELFAAKSDAPPSDLPPALAGALVAGHVRDDQIEGTIFDFARRKMLALEPTDHNLMQVKLLTNGSHLTGYEASVWASLAQQAGRDKIIPNSLLADVRAQWYSARADLQAELVQRGWFDANASARRQPYYLLGWVCLGLAALGVLLAFIGLNGYALLGTLLSLVIGVIMFSKGAAILDTTEAGEEAALPWRAFAARLSSGSIKGNGTEEMDTLLPYAIALGVSYALTPQLQAASNEGYMPSWFVPGRYYNRSLGFYPYWMMWHSSIYPVTTSTGMYHGGFSGGGFSGGSFGGGGAAAGGGGAGGAF